MASCGGAEIDEEKSSGSVVRFGPFAQLGGTIGGVLYSMAKQKSANRSSSGKSALLTLMHRGLDKLGKALSNSAVVRFFCSYDDMEEYAASSMTVGGSQTIARNIKNKFTRKPRRELGTEQFKPDEVGIFAPGSLPRSLKNRIGEAVEGSVLLTKAVELIWKLLYMPMMYFGVFLFSFGLFTTVSQALLYFLLSSNDVAAVLDLFVGLVLVLLSLLVMFKGYDPMLDAFRESLVGSFVIRMLNGRPVSETTRKKHHSAGLFFVAGMLCGLVTLAIEPLVLIALLLSAVFAICVFFVPESGVCVLLFALPFLSLLSVSAKLPVLAILYIGVCLLLKVMVGRRSISIGFLDGWILMFLAIVLSTGYAGGKIASDSALLYGAMISGYFVMANLLRSSKWIRRSISALTSSAFIVSILGIITHYLPFGFTLTLFDDPMAATCYLLAIIPLTLVSMLRGEHRTEKTANFFALGAEIAYLILLGSYIGIFALVVELLFFFLFYTRKTWTSLVLIILTLPIVSYVVQPDYSALQLRISQSTGGELWKGLGQVFADAPLSGIGMSDVYLQHALEDAMANQPADLSLTNTFMRILVQVGIPGAMVFLVFILMWYAAGFTLLCKCGTKDKSTAAHLAFMAALTGLLLAGNFSYLWSDPRLLLLFWMCAGIARALRRVAKRSEWEDPLSAERRDGVQCVDIDLTMMKSGGQKTVKDSPR